MRDDLRCIIKNCRKMARGIDEICYSCRKLDYKNLPKKTRPLNSVAKETRCSYRDCHTQVYGLHIRCSKHKRIRTHHKLSHRCAFDGCSEKVKGAGIRCDTHSETYELYYGDWKQGRFWKPNDSGDGMNYTGAKSSNFGKGETDQISLRMGPRRNTI